MPKNKRSKTFTNKSNRNNRVKSKHKSKVKYPKLKVKNKKNQKRTHFINDDEDINKYVLLSLNVKEPLPEYIDVIKVNLPPEPEIKKENLIKLQRNVLLLNEFKNRANINIYDTELIYNSGYGNCWFKAVSQALYDEEKFHLTIRNKIYKELLKKKMNIKETN